MCFSIAKRPIFPKGPNNTKSHREDGSRRGHGEVAGDEEQNVKKPKPRSLIFNNLANFENPKMEWEYIFRRG